MRSGYVDSCHGVDALHLYYLVISAVFLLFSTVAIKIHMYKKINNWTQVLVCIALCCGFLTVKSIWSADIWSAFFVVFAVFVS